MKIINFEFKAKANNLEKLEKKLLELKPLYKGEDHQTDTYYNISNGRLKLREGKIENALVYYERENTSEAKESKIILYQHQPDNSLKEILQKVHGIKVIVTKKRKIYFIENVKFHFDTVSELGTFIEVEAIDEKGNIGTEKLKDQCLKYFEFFELDKKDFINCSYSDLVADIIPNAKQ